MNVLNVLKYGTLCQMKLILVQLRSFTRTIEHLSFNDFVSYS